MQNAECTLQMQECRMQNAKEIARLQASGRTWRLRPASAA